MNAAAPSASQRTVRFRVGALTAALAAADVAEIVRRPRTIRVPHGPGKLIGLANLRGVATPIFSLAKLLGQTQDSDGAWVVVLNRNPALGLVVDRVDSVADGDDAAPGTLTVAEGGKQRSIALTGLLQGQAASVRTKTQVTFPDIAEIAGARHERRHEGTTIGLLSFTLAGQNYALPLTDIVEVAPLPARIKAGRDASLGKATIRGRKVELISLSALLGLGDAAVAGNERVIVVAFDGRRIGLVADGARTILRAPGTTVAAPPTLLNRESDAARIQSVVRMPDGRGVVSVLTVESLFGGHAGPANAATADVREATGRADETHRFVIFRVGDEDYGYPIEAIGEIVRPPAAMTLVPGAPKSVAGTVNLRGRVVPILDQRQRFGAVAASADHDDRILVVDIAGVRTGLLVDGVSDIKQVDAARIGAAPELSGGTQRLFDRVITARQDDPMILVVNPDMLLSRAELDQLAVIGGADAEATPT